MFRYTSLLEKGDRKKPGRAGSPRKSVGPSLRWTALRATAERRRSNLCNPKRQDSKFTEEAFMPMVQVKLIEGVFTEAQKRQMVQKLTDAMVSIEGENMRPVTL